MSEKKFEKPVRQVKTLKIKANEIDVTVCKNKHLFVSYKELEKIFGCNVNMADYGIFLNPQKEL